MGKLSSYTPVTTAPALTDEVPITSSAISTPQTRNVPVSLLLADPGAQVFNVKAFGAKGDGVTDDVLGIQGALAAAVAAGGGVVFLPAGTYRISNVSNLSSNTRLQGAGMGITTIRYTGATAATNMFQLVSGTVRQSNIHIEGITFDAQDIANKGILNLNGVVTDLTIAECELKNVGFTTASKWPLRIGAVVDADLLGSASFNVEIRNCQFTNNNCGTFEVILLPNVRDSWIHHNKFENNSNQGAREISLYSFNYNVKVTDNIHKNWSDYAVGGTEGDQNEIARNTFVNTLTTATAAIAFYNQSNGRVSDNLIELSSSGTTEGISLQDYNVGRDGHSQLNPNSFNIDISNNRIVNAFYGIHNFATGSFNYGYTNITIQGNNFYNILKAPIRFGPNATGLAMDIQFIHVKNNVVHSWSGNIEGAIGFYGDSTAPTQIKNIYIENNFIANNTTGATSGAIRLSGAQATTISRNVLTATGSFGPVQLLNGASFQVAEGNIGWTGDFGHFNVKTYGVLGDVRQVADGAISASSSSLTSASAKFTAADVGKTLVVFGAAAAGGVLTTTISAYVSSSQVTLSGAATTAVSSAITYLGSDDTAAIQNVITIANAAGGGTVYFPKASYLVSPETIQLASNVLLEGQTRDNTIIYMKDNGSIQRIFNSVGTSGTNLTNIGLKRLFLSGVLAAPLGTSPRPSTFCNTFTYVKGVTIEDVRSEQVEQSFKFSNCSHVRVNRATDYSGGIGQGTKDVVNAIDCTDVVVGNCITYCNDTTFRIQGTKQVTIHDNFIAGAAGIEVSNSSTNYSEAINIANNYFEDSAFNCAVFADVATKTLGNGSIVAIDGVSITGNSFLITNNARTGQKALILETFTSTPTAGVSNVSITGNSFRSTVTGSSISEAIVTMPNNNGSVIGLTVSGNTFMDWNCSALNLTSVMSCDIGNNIFVNWNVGGGLGSNWNRAAIAVRGISGKPSSHVNIHDNTLDADGNVFSFPVYLGTDTFLNNINVKRNYMFNVTGSNAVPLKLETVQPSGTIYDNQGVNPIGTFVQGNITGATTFTCVNGSVITATLTGNITVTLTAGIALGDELALQLKQDGTGSRTVTWPANFKKAGGTLTSSTGAGQTDVVKMRWDGTNWNETSRALNVS